MCDQSISFEEHQTQPEGTSNLQPVAMAMIRTGREEEGAGLERNCK